MCAWLVVRACTCVGCWCVCVGVWFLICCVWLCVRPFALLSEWWSVVLSSSVRCVMFGGLCVLVCGLIILWLCGSVDARHGTEWSSYTGPHNGRMLAIWPTGHVQCDQLLSVSNPYSLGEEPWLRSQANKYEKAM